MMVDHELKDVSYLFRVNMPISYHFYSIPAMASAIDAIRKWTKRQNIKILHYMMYMYGLII